MKKDPEVKRAVDSLRRVQPLHQREGLFGGRTNAVQLCAKVDGTNEKISYVDLISLYPSVNLYGWYPFGHPEIITTNFSPFQVCFGVVKCVVPPPRKLFHPVLPSKINDKLMFVLCRTCAEKGDQSGTCSHTDDERALTGV